MTAIDIHNEAQRLAQADFIVLKDECVGNYDFPAGKLFVPIRFRLYKSHGDTDYLLTVYGCEQEFNALDFRPANVLDIIRARLIHAQK